jgi:excisionase family DNA binding protein
MASKSKKSAKKKAAVAVAPAVSGVTKAAADQASPLKTEVEAATYLRISRTTLIRLRQRGEISSTRVGNRVFYTQGQLDRYIGRSEVSETQALQEE